MKNYEKPLHCETRHDVRVVSGEEIAFLPSTWEKSSKMHHGGSHLLEIEQYSEHVWKESIAEI